MRCENCGEVLKESKAHDKKENKIDTGILVCDNCGQESKIITI